MAQRIVIGGCGFAGLWAALSASRAVALAGRQGDVDVVVVSPAPALVIRPRLYEAELGGMNPDVSELLAAVGARHVPGVVEAIDDAGRTITLATLDGTRQMIGYDRLVCATGSQLHRPAIPGLADHAFDTDQLNGATALDAHLRSLDTRTASAARNTVVVAGGGSTGLETAMDMPIRLRAALGRGADFRVILIDTADRPGGSLGADPAPYFAEALAFAGVEVRNNARVEAVAEHAVTLSSGEKIETDTLVWAAGLRASPLAAQIPGEHDALGRVIVDAWLRAPSANGIFVTGDTAHVATDDLGNVAAMSCQHALSLGRVGGHNAAAELVGLPLHPYSQPKYVTCVDLGEWGALYTEGWDRQVRLIRGDAKALKRDINRVWIYPPKADRDGAFAVANPDYVVVP
ncbi:NAD(P)/FAD-dependent oxidoreductase [Novosphingobium sp. LASN5T]|nr:NAD(P)/FAD-dependent oxidoreductase [Novosphingobium sp. LASN5T]